MRNMPRVGEYIWRNLPPDQYPGKTNEFVVNQYRAKQCSFDQVLIRYHYLLVKESLDPMPGMDQEDVYQELVMKLLKCCDKWDPYLGVSFSTYITEACINHKKSILRKQLNAKRGGTFTKTVSLEELLFDEDGTRNHINEPSVDFIVPVEVVLIGLPITDRERQYVIPLMKGLSLGEIAEKLGVTRTRVTQVLRGIGKRFRSRSLSLF